MAQSAAKRIASGDELPAELQPKPGEPMEQWIARLRAPQFMHTLLASRKYAETAFGWHYNQQVLDRVYPAKQEIDVTARQDDWLRNLTDEELAKLDELRQLAMARQHDKPSTLP